VSRVDQAGGRGAARGRHRHEVAIERKRGTELIRDEHFRCGNCVGHFHTGVELIAVCGAPSLGATKRKDRRSAAASLVLLRLRADRPVDVLDSPSRDRRQQQKCNSGCDPWSHSAPSPRESVRRPSGRRCRQSYELRKPMRIRGRSGPERQRASRATPADAPSSRNLLLRRSNSQGIFWRGGAPAGHSASRVLASAVGAVTSLP
jgi:hypothetical protein